MSFTISWSLLKLRSTGSVMSSNHLILSSPSPPALNFSQHQSLFQWIGSSHQVPRVLELRFSISPSKEYSRLISPRIDWFDLLAVQGTLKCLLQHHSSKAPIFQCSAFFMVQLSHPDMITRKTMALTRQNFVGRVMSLVFESLSCNPTYSLSSFTFIKRLFSSSSLSAIRVVSSAYLRLLIFVPAIWIPVCESSSQAFHMMYTA